MFKIMLTLIFRVRLNKRRLKPGAQPSNSKLIVKHRPLNEIEFKTQVNSFASLVVLKIINGTQNFMKQDQLAIHTYRRFTVLCAGVNLQFGIKFVSCFLP